LVIIVTAHYGKKKFDSEGEEAAEIRKKISFDYWIIKKKYKKQSFPFEFERKKQKCKKNCNPYHVIVHLHAFIDVVF